MELLLMREYVPIQPLEVASSNPGLVSTFVFSGGPAETTVGNKTKIAKITMAVKKRVN